VFWDNPDGIMNTYISEGKFNTPECSIIGDTAFHRFLNWIDPLGNDICLHTPEQYTTTPQRLETALEFMQLTFASPSWIDHGYNNKTQNNREDLICDGSIPESDYYAIPLWEEYGVNYLWNAYYEEYSPFAEMQFSNNLEKPYSGFGDFYPKPDYWQHPSRTADVSHWPTKSVLFVPDNNFGDITSITKNAGGNPNYVSPSRQMPMNPRFVDSATSLPPVMKPTIAGNPMSQNTNDFGGMNDRLFAIAFNTMSTRNAGFATMNLNALSDATINTFSIMMYIGSGPGSTAGGIRTTTLFVMVVAISQFIGGRKDATAFKRNIPSSTVKKSFVMNLLDGYVDKDVVIHFTRMINDAGVQSYPVEICGNELWHIIKKYELDKLVEGSVLFMRETESIAQETETGFIDRVVHYAKNQKTIPK